MKHTFTLPEIYKNERLDQVLAKILPEYSRTQIKEWIDAGLVQINGAPAKAKIRIKGGEQIQLETRVKPPLTLEAQNIPLSIVYEDDDLIILNKPMGMIVHPGAGNSDKTLLNALLYHDSNLKHLPRGGILHRLDKDTSGLLIVAKNSSALAHLSHQLKKRKLVREYQAVVCGHLISGGKIDAPIQRHPLQRKQMAVVETGKKAITHYRIAEKYRAHTRLNIRLETGRTHQIRVHMAYIKHPVVGDKTYGKRLQLTKGMTPDLIETLRQFKRQALHAYAVEFEHPSSKKIMRFEVQMPEDMLQLIHALQKDLKVRNSK